MKALSLLLAVAGLSLSVGAGPASAQPRYDGLALPFREVVVSSPVQAQVEVLNVREGDSVKAGAPLGQLFAQIEELEMRRAQAALEKREFEFKGLQNLFKERLISEDEALASRIELDLARLTYEIAQRHFELRQIKAPIDGVVVERRIEVGETATSNQPLFVLVDITKIYVQFYLRAEELAHVRRDQTAAVVFNELDPNREFRGKVDFVDPRVDASSGLARVRVLLENPEETLKAGLRASVRLIQ